MFSKYFKSFVALVVLACSQSIGAQRNVVVETRVPAVKPDVVASRATSENGTPIAFRYLKVTGLAAFIAKANEFAAEGYRLQSLSLTARIEVIDDPRSATTFDEIGLAAIFQLSKDENYEYDWFVSFTPGEIVTRITHGAKKGFYFRKSVPVIDNSKCGSSNSDPDDTIGQIIGQLSDLACGASGDIFIMERLKGKASDMEYRLLLGIWGLGKSPTAEIESDIADRAKIGFYPVSMGNAKSGFKEATYVLMERPKIETAMPIPFSYKYVKSEFGFQKKVNEAALDGYRIKFSSTIGAFRHVLMEKGSPAAPISYVWVKGGSKKGKAELTSAVRSGSVYEANNRVTEELMFRSHRPAGFEYELLRMVPEYPKRTKENPDPAPLKSQAQILSEFDSMLLQGYAARDVVYVGGPNVLFERAKK